MYTYLAEKYKHVIKRKYFNEALGIKNKYAFIGTGRHAVTQLYPLLQHFAVPLKYIFSKNESNARAMCAVYKNAIPANNLSQILDDKEIHGVFICTTPQQHFALVNNALEADKNVFVEKPVCYSKNELEILISKQRARNVHVNFQHRYSPAVRLLKKHASATQFYRHEYLTGLYAEGDALTELFIHSLDILLFLFGNISSFTCKKIINARAVTYLIHTSHAGGATGEVKLSTAYSWQNAAESYELHTGKNIISCSYPYEVKRTQLPPVVAGLPLDKLYKNPLRQDILLNGNTIDTSLANHSSYLHGFYTSIQSFLKHAEQNKPVDLLASLLPLYSWIEEIKRI